MPVPLADFICPRRLACWSSAPSQHPKKSSVLVLVLVLGPAVGSRDLWSWGSLCCGCRLLSQRGVGVVVPGLPPLSFCPPPLASAAPPASQLNLRLADGLTLVAATARTP